MREGTYHKRKKGGYVAALLIFVLIAAIAVVFGLFRVRKLTITGNTCYASSKIQEAIMQDGLCSNTLYLMWKFNDQEKVEKTLPFLSGAEVTMVKPYEVEVKVYEKPQIGYFLNQGSYVYFDKEGMVVEISGEIHKDVPLITGLEVEKAELYEQLPVKDESLYNTIVTLTKNLNKNDTVPDEIRFGSRGSITLVFGSISVNLGSDTALADKVSALGSILSQLEGKSGILYMEGYAENDGTVTFKSDTGDAQTVTDGTENGDGENADGTGTPDNGNQEADSQSEAGITYSESDGTFSTDAEGNKTYTDANGITTTQCEEYNYTDENGNIITDGYGYIDPYTGSYVLGSP